MAVSSHHQVALVLCRIFLYQGQIALTFIVCAFSQFLVHAVQAFFHLCDVSKGLLGFFTDSGVVLKIHHLRQITDSAVVRDAHGSCRSLLLTTEYLQHRRLASSVLTHKGDTVFVIDDETGINEQRLHTKLYFQSFY